MFRQAPLHVLLRHDLRAVSEELLVVGGVFLVMIGRDQQPDGLFPDPPGLLPERSEVARILTIDNDRSIGAEAHQRVALA